MDKSESNKLIAEFMGGRYNEVHDCLIWDNLEESPINKENWISINRLKYHSSWDWLMPVVEKIESIKITSDVNGGGLIKFSFLKSDNGFNIIIVNCPAYHFDLIRKENKNKIKAVYEAVIDFIKWYNENNEAPKLG